MQSTDYGETGNTEWKSRTSECKKKKTLWALEREQFQRKDCFKSTACTLKALWCLTFSFCSQYTLYVFIDSVFVSTGKLYKEKKFSTHLAGGLINMGI